VTITASHLTEARAKQAVDAAFRELELVESVLSIYRPQSQVSLLNREGQVANAHPYLLEVLQAAEQIAQQSAGAFDITVQPLWEIYSAAKKRGELPPAEQITQTVALVDWRQVHLEGANVRLKRSGAKITLNGIAQGFAADRVAAMLRNHGVEHGLVNAGEFAPLGRSQRGDAWTVGIQHPRQPEAFAALAELDGRALSTSGDYATTFSDDFTHHHLLDPHRGCSPTELSSVTVLAATAMEADALSTAVFVLGVERGVEFIAHRPGVDALLMRRDGGLVRSAGFPLSAKEDVL